MLEDALLAEVSETYPELTTKEARQLAREALVNVQAMLERLRAGERYTGSIRVLTVEATLDEATQVIEQTVEAYTGRAAATYSVRGLEYKNGKMTYAIAIEQE